MSFVSGNGSQTRYRLLFFFFLLILFLLLAAILDLITGYLAAFVLPVTSLIGICKLAGLFIFSSSIISFEPSSLLSARASTGTWP